MSWKKRVELLNNRLKRINEELEKRDLADIPTDKLIDMQSKLLDKLKLEHIDIKLKESMTTTEAIDEMLYSKEVKKWIPE